MAECQQLERGVCEIIFPYMAALNVILQQNRVFHDFTESKVIHNG